MRRPRLTYALAAVLLTPTYSLAGCGDFLGIHDSSGSDDAGEDTALHTTGGVDADADASSPVAKVDGSTDAGVDASDASGDRLSDAGVDASDASVDSSADARVDPSLWATPLPSMQIEFADVTGDRKVDLIGIEPDQVVVWPSDGTRFVPHTTAWLSQAPAGDIGVFFVDVNGDRRADLLVDDSVAGVSLALSTGQAFGPFTLWATAFHGDLMTAFADVNGDGMADGVGVESTNVYVALTALTQSGTPYAAPGSQFLTNVFYGNASPHDALASAVGTNMADLIGFDLTSGIHVLPSMGSYFDGDAGWLGSSWTEQQPFGGTEGTFIADVNGDGKSDAIAVDATGIQVRLSTGSAFVVPAGGANWTTTPFYGSVATFFADVDGDGDADAIAVDNGAIRVWLSTGSSFVAQ